MVETDDVLLSTRNYRSYSDRFSLTLVGPVKYRQTNNQDVPLSGNTLAILIQCRIVVKHINV